LKLHSPGICITQSPTRVRNRRTIYRNKVQKRKLSDEVIALEDSCDDEEPPKKTINLKGKRRDLKPNKNPKEDEEIKSEPSTSGETLKIEGTSDDSDSDDLF
jgi:hypothetical protein